MVYKKIKLSETDDNVFMEACIADKVGDFVRKAILVIPGGGYAELCSEREGEPVGMAFMPYGYNYFVLHYSVNRVKRFPSQLIEASLAIKHIKDHAKEYNIDPNQVFVTGFSAGGHLCACCGTMWNRKEIYDEIEMPYGYNKPRGIMPIYPVVSYMVPEAGGGIMSGNLGRRIGATFMNLLCSDNPGVEELRDCSVENFVTQESCHAFIVHTSNDETVSVNNSLLLAQAYAAANAEFELHIYPDAPHGVALGNKITKCGVEKWCNQAIAKWVEQAAFWADNVKCD